MAGVTLRVLDGADRGRVFDTLPTPVTIGREEGNSVQLNDERISRFHIKIQEDQGKLVLTDLESTNGTRDQIAGRLDELREDGMNMTGELDPAKLMQEADSSLDFEVRWGASENLHSTLHLPAPPELPLGLSPGQAAQLSEVLEYLHLRSRSLIQSASLPEGTSKITLDLSQWQEILDLQALLAEYLRKVGGSDAE